MARYEPGDTFRMTLSTTQPGPPMAPVDADTVTLTIIDPDGSVTNRDLDDGVEHPTTGSYYYDHVIAAAGTTLYKWNAVGTDPAPWQVVESDQVYGATPGPRLLSLSEAKDALKYKRNQPTDQDNDQLNNMIDSITERIESVCGPVLPRTVTERLRVDARGVFVLRQWPVLELVDIDGDSSPTVMDNLTLTDPDIGRGTAKVLYSYPYGQGMITYRAGRDPVPPGIRDGAAAWLRHLWRGAMQRSAANPGSTLATSDFQARDDQQGPTYGMPFEVMDALRPYARDGML